LLAGAPDPEPREDEQGGQDQQHGEALTEKDRRGGGREDRDDGLDRAAVVADIRRWQAYQAT
jgi:hypothetical protein